jgi:hypothetical protein
MNDLAGYKIRELSWMNERDTTLIWTYLASGELVQVLRYENGMWGIVMVPDKGGDEHFAAASKEDAIEMCDKWQREAVMRLLEKA